MTQGGLILPTIFNVMLDTVVHHWEYLVEEGGGGDDRDNRRGSSRKTNGQGVQQWPMADGGREYSVKGADIVIIRRLWDGSLH